MCYKLFCRCSLPLLALSLCLSHTGCAPSEADGSREIFCIYWIIWCESVPCSSLLLLLLFINKYIFHSVSSSPFSCKLVVWNGVDIAAHSFACDKWHRRRKRSSLCPIARVYLRRVFVTKFIFLHFRWHCRWLRVEGNKLFFFFSSPLHGFVRDAVACCGSWLKSRSLCIC